MKTTVRQGVFETNSSSTHSLTMCILEDYEAWQKGEVYFDRYKKTFVKAEDLTEEQKADPTDSDLYTIEDWNAIEEYESFSQRFNVGEKTVVAFGYYGYN